MIKLVSQTIEPFVDVQAQSSCFAGAASPEHRREPRFSTSTAAVVHAFRPPMPDRFAGSVLDVSRHGMRVRIAHRFETGTEIQVIFQNLIVLGRVRYAKTLGDTFDHGMAIEEVLNCRTKAEEFISTHQILDAVMAGTPASEIRPRLTSIDPVCRQTLLCSICKLHHEIAANSLDHAK